MIYKHTFQVVVYTDETARDYNPDDLEVLHYDITDGDWIGNTTHLGTVEVPAEELTAELVAIGNDGTFFDTFSNDAHENAHEAGSATLVYREGCSQCEYERALNTP